MKSIIDTVFFKSKSHHNHSTESRKRGGFTMAELLIVVAIMIILFGFAFAGIVNFIRNLNQTELDKTAEVIYVAAQNRMSEIYASGEAHKLTPASANQGGLSGVYVVVNEPSDWDSSVSGEYPTSDKSRLCRIESTSGEAAAYLFPENSIIAEEWRSDNWVVEYDPDTLMVYSVFFSKKLEPSAFYKDNAVLRPVDAVGARRNYGATVGYYGGPVAALNHEQVRTIYCQVKTEEFNKEKLFAQITIGNIPAITVGGMGVSSSIDLNITVIGESSKNQVVLTRELTPADIDAGDNSMRTCFLLLDGLDDGEHFNQQFCSPELLMNSKKGASSRDIYTVDVDKTTGVLVPGENITIKVEAMPRNPYVNSPSPAEDTTNSLFASLEVDGDIKAEVAYGRHLQNLDSAISGFDANSIGTISGNSDTKVNVFQIPNQEGVDAIDFSKYAPENASPSVNEISPITERIKYYYATYGERSFESVINRNIESYDGQKNKIIGANVVSNNHATDNNENVGLFGVFTGSLLKDMYIINERIEGYAGNTGATGGIAGVTNNDVRITGCMNYLKQDIDDKWDADTTTASNSDWIKGGTYVGGLIGDAKASVTIMQSMASSVIKTNISAGTNPGNYVGGLIGSSNAAVSIEQSYTDSYLSGEQIAGMVANAKAPVSISKSYVAGFALQQDATATTEGKYYKKGAAFVGGTGKTDISYSYSVFDFDDPTPDIKKPGMDDHITKSIAENEGSLNAVFYTFSDGNDQHDTATNTKGVSKQNLRDAVSPEVDVNISDDALLIRGLFGDVFVMSTANNSYPYNLTKDFNLTVYPYPSLETRHYGDWTLFDIEPGTLVYFERYTNGNGNSFYRFNGGGKSYLLSYEELKKNNLHVDLDGYAILFPLDDPSKAYERDVYLKYDADASTDNITLTLSPGSDKNFTATFDVSGKSKSFELRPIPYYMDANSVNGIQAKAQEGRYYVPLTVVNDSGRTSKYYFNPHFASTVVEISDFEKDAIIGVANNHVSIRTPRQLYLLSLYYPEYSVPTQLATYKQELDLDYKLYNWDDIRTVYNNPIVLPVDAVGGLNGHKCQFPIGYSTVKNSYADFTSTYDGGCRLITNVGMAYNNKGESIGLFGVVGKQGVIKNVVFANNYSANDFYTLSYDNPATYSAVRRYEGMMAGVNAGTITNCAVTGMIFNGSLYDSSQLFLGGFVGSNTGVIERCSADIPRIITNINVSSHTDTGAFAGFNSGTIRQSFANGRISVPDSDGKGNQSISGFVGDNIGRIENSYCSTSKQVARVDSNSVYGFTSRNGTVSGCYYLNDDAYYYVDDLYAYSDSNAGGATAIHGPELKNKSIPGFGKAVFSSFNYNTLSHDASSTIYPYPSSVKDEFGNYVYYGEWPIEESYGDFGFYYWEKEEDGSNNGYHFYLMTNNTIDGKPQIKSTLCTSHDDGGRITAFGYGYYNEASKDSVIGEAENTIQWTNINPGKENDEANSKLSESIGEGKYKFHSFTTMSAFGSASEESMYLCTSGLNVIPSRINKGDAATTGWGSITIGKMENPGDGESQKPVTFYFSPFFAASMVRSDEGDVPESLVGLEGHRFQIRSVDQLQFINWNNENNNTKIWLNKSYFNNVNDGEVGPAYRVNATAISFPYLGYAYSANSNTVQHHKAVLYWNQTHDLNADMNPNATQDSELFTPIGSLYDSNYANSTNNSYVYTNYFNGYYYGNSYAIKNIQIKSSAQSVGLFGITIGAHIDHLVLYSDKNNTIGTTDSDESFGWYNLGGVVGTSLIGGSGIKDKTSDVGFYSCAVAGYRIENVRKNTGFGGANVGGFSGLSCINFQKCSAVNDIYINPKYNNSLRCVRVGGVVGNFRGDEMSNCYSGGRILRTVSPENKATQVSFGGLVGGWFMRTQGNMNSLFGLKENNKPKISNSYSYVDPRGFRNAEERDEKDVIRPIASTCYEKNTRFAIVNCYYYEPTDYVYSTKLTNNEPYEINPWEENKVTYNQLSGKEELTEFNDIYAKLNGKNFLVGHNPKAEYDPWFRVTSYELPSGDEKYPGGHKVDGKFSFPGTDTSLDKKNYPFPTIVDQIDAYGETVRVHYGAWPKANGIFVSHTEANLDLVSKEDQKLNVTISYYNENGEHVDIAEATKIVIKKQNGDNPDTIDASNSLVTIDGKQCVNMELAAKKIGAENLVISYELEGKTYQAEIAIHVTADVMAIAEPIDQRENLTNPKYSYLVDYPIDGGDKYTGTDFAFNSEFNYYLHNELRYRLVAKDRRGNVLYLDQYQDSNWSVELPVGIDAICTIRTEDVTEKVMEGEREVEHTIRYLIVTATAPGDTSINYQFDTKIRTGEGDNTAKSGNQSIMITIKEHPDYNLDKYTATTSLMMLDLPNEDVAEKNPSAELEGANSNSQEMINSSDGEKLNVVQDTQGTVNDTTDVSAEVTQNTQEEISNEDEQIQQN